MTFEKKLQIADFKLKAMARLANMQSAI